MSHLIRLLILFFAATWLLRQAAELRESWDCTRQNPRWQVIQEDLQNAGDEALNWAEEALRERRMRE